MTTPIQFTASVLRTVLSGLSRVIDKKSTLPVLTYIRVDPVEGTLRFTASNFDHCLTYVHPTEPPPLTQLGRKLASIRWGLEAASILIPEQTLKNTLKAVGRADSIITIGAGTISYQVGSSPISTTFAITDQELPEPPSLALSLPVRLDAIDRAALIQANTFVSEDETRYVLRGVYLETTDSNDLPCAPSIISTDGRRLHQCSMPSIAALGANIIVSSETIRILAIPSLREHEWLVGHLPAPIKNSDEGAEYKDGCDTLTVIAGPWQLRSKLIEGRFPNYRQVIPADLDNHITVSVDQQPHVTFCNILAHIPPAQSDTVHLLFNGTHLEIRNDFGFSANVLGIVSNAPMRISVCRHFLADCLACGPGYFRILDALTPLIHFSGTAVNVLMPVRGIQLAVPDPEREAKENEWKGRIVLYPVGDKNPQRGEVIGTARQGLKLRAIVKMIDCEDPIEVPFSDIAEASGTEQRKRSRKAA